MLYFSKQHKRDLSVYCSRDGYKSDYLYPVVFRKDSLMKDLPQNAKKIAGLPPAFSFGGLIPSAVLGAEISKRPTPVGVFLIDDELKFHFNDKEINYLLAHEYSHIINNHRTWRYLGGVADNIAKCIISQIRDNTKKTVIGMAWSSIETLGNVEFQKQFEIEADAHALELTGDKQIAQSAIFKSAQKFANGDLNAPSHFTIRNGIRSNIITYQQRLNALKLIPPGKIKE